MTPGKIAELERLRAEGKSARDVAEAIGVSHRTVLAWEEKRRRVNATSAPSEAEHVAAAAAIVSSPLPRAEDPEALQKARARHEMVQRLLESLTNGVVLQTFPATSYVTLARYGDDLVRVIAELTPPAPKDPNEDPDVRESERVLVSRIEKMVEEAETRGAAKP
jgi:transcriptional regulator with XRE-family HTH domain